MKQYLALKDAHRDCLLFFRLGDFYELFFEDAVLVAKLLQLTLTSRDKNEDNPIPMCGVPYHAAKGYMAKLIDAGYKVAVCEQMEEATAGKGLVRREVTQILAPGTFIDEAALLPHAPHYLAFVVREGDIWSLAFADLSVGELYISTWPDTARFEEAFLRLDPRHLVVDKDLAEDPAIARISAASSKLFVEVLPIAKSPVRPPPAAIMGEVRPGLETTLALSLWAYLEANQADLLAALSPFRRYSEHAVLPIDKATQVHLELFKTYDGQNAGSLFHHLNDTKTPMGARLLRSYLLHPSTDLGEILSRQKAVDMFLAEGFMRRALRQALDGVYDLERLQGKVQAGRATPRDLAALQASALALSRLEMHLQADLIGERLLRRKRDLSLSPDFAVEIERVLAAEPPVTIRDGGAIRDGVSPELDRLRLIVRDGKGYLAQLERDERDRTGIASLKIRYNRIFGYYLEVTHAHKHKVPEHYIRKQTTVGSERYVTEALKRVEDEILGAEHKILVLEAALFEELCARVAGHAEAVRRAAKAAAELDVLLAFAELAEKYHYVMPEVHSGYDTVIRDGRHPTLERALQKGRFIANDIAFRRGESEMILITGPNMAGKSTVMRQTALLIILAQMGAFVPAKEASIAIVDRIFTRIGASDNLLQGKSTFMMEMVETAEILRAATARSFIILDEIGRGTSTFDGLSLARAVAEHLAATVGAKTLFATHYHELAELEAHYPQVQGHTMSIKEWQGELIFLYRLVRGNASRSYGIDVARLAGLPEPVIARAREVLAALELGETVSEERLDASFSASPPPQLELFEQSRHQALRDLKEIEVDALTPLEALNTLARLKQTLFPT